MNLEEIRAWTRDQLAARTAYNADRRAADGLCATCDRRRGLHRKCERCRAREKAEYNRAYNARKAVER